MTTALSFGIMPLLAIVIGSLLTLIAIAGYVIGAMGDYASWTALIPAFAGVPILVFGILARANPDLRKHMMHGAVVFGLLGALAPLGRLPVTLRADPINYVSATSMILMIVLCAFFTIACVRSFIAARRSRTASAA